MSKSKSQVESKSEEGMSIFWIEKANVFHFETQADFFSFAEATNAFRGKNQIPFFSRERAMQKRPFVGDILPTWQNVASCDVF